jgi:transcriptional regulator with XRE-family HTH domain
MAQLRAAGLTFEEIARVFGVTRQRVGRLLHRSVAESGVRCRACRNVVATSFSPARSRGPLLCLTCLVETPGVPFGERLRTHRLIAGLTQEELATCVGVAELTISLYERGMRRPSADTLGQLAVVLGDGLLDGG